MRADGFASLYDRIQWMRAASGAGVAHTAVARAIRHGQLKPVRGQQCADCGAPAVHYDHRDYGKPLEVEPVCRSCNVRRGPARWINAEA